MTAEEALLVARLCRALESAILRGNDGDAKQRMMDPRPGDLVVEITRFGPPRDPDMVGRLIAIEGPADNPDRYVIEPLHRLGERQGWENATFAAMPEVHPGQDGPV